jgi:hypothetical protein
MCVLHIGDYTPRRGCSKPGSYLPAMTQAIFDGWMLERSRKSAGAIRLVLARSALLAYGRTERFGYRRLLFGFFDTWGSGHPRLDEFQELLLGDFEVLGELLGLHVLGHDLLYGLLGGLHELEGVLVILS